MPISHKNKFIFVHITKNGGTSIEKALGILGIFKKNKLYGFEDRNGNYLSCKKALKLNKIEREEKKLVCLQHLTAREIKYRLDELTWNKYFKFAFVRNPWARIVSEYSYRMQKRQDIIKSYGLNNESSFKEYIYAMKDNNKIIKQADYITDKNCNIMVDFIGRLENIDNDYRIVCEKIGIKSKLKKKNKSVHKDYKEYYNSETKKLVEKLYKKDIELFNYSF